MTSPFVGGGFGGKTLWFHHVLAGGGRPSSRADRCVSSSRARACYRAVGGRTTTEQRVALGASEDGRLEALIHTGVAAMTPHNDCPEQFTFPARHLYASRTLKLVAGGCGHEHGGEHVHAGAGVNRWGPSRWRIAIDELAERLELDPIELRMRNEAAEDPRLGTALLLTPPRAGVS